MVADNLRQIKVEEDNMQIIETFPDEHLFAIGKEPWYATIINYSASG